MYSLILAAETAKDALAGFPGDAFMPLALALLVVALLVAAVATLIVTPGPDHH